MDVLLAHICQAPLAGALMAQESEDALGGVAESSDSGADGSRGGLAALQHMAQALRQRVQQWAWSANSLVNRGMSF